MKEPEISRKVSANLRENENILRSRLENCAIILIRRLRLGENHKVDCLMVYIEVAVSNMMLDDSCHWKDDQSFLGNFSRTDSGICSALTALESQM